MLRQPVENFCRDGLAKAEASACDRLLERTRRHDDDVVAAGTKRASETNERMDVAGGADGSHDEKGFRQSGKVEKWKSGEVSVKSGASHDQTLDNRPGRHGGEGSASRSVLLSRCARHDVPVPGA